MAAGGVEGRGQDREGYKETDRNRDWQCDAHSTRDRHRDHASDRARDDNMQTGMPSQQRNHVNELGKQIFCISDAREVFGGRDGPDRQQDRRKVRLEDRDSNSLRAPYTCSERLLTLQTQ